MRLCHSLIFLLALSVHRPALEAAEITRAAEIRELSPQEAAAPREVRVKGVVTLLWRGGAEAFVVQDESAGIWVNTRVAMDRGIWQGRPEEAEALRPGSVVEVLGVSDPGGFAPMILPREVRSLGEAPLPTPAELDAEAVRGGAADSQRVRLRGVVRDCVFVSSGWGARIAMKPLFLRVETALGPVTVQVSAPTRTDAHTWIDATVEATGIGATVFNGRAEFMEMRLLMTSDADVRIVAPPPADSFSAPKVALLDLARFSPAGRPQHRVRIEGTVTLCQPHEHLFLQEGAQGVRVRLRDAENFSPGDRLEAVGFVDQSGVTAEMVHAVVRKIGVATPPSPMPLDRKTLQLAFKPMDRGLRPAPSDFDALLVQTQATLLAMQSDPEGPLRLVLELGGEMSFATVPRPDAPADRERLANLRAGSLLSITGIAELEYHQLSDAPALAGRPKGFDLLLRDVADIRVLHAASWWTPDRIWAVLGFVAAGLVLALLWIGLLHRQVRAQGLQLAAEVKARRDVAVDFQATLRERNRLAANLHDTLLQTLGGINFQLDACEVSARRDPAASGAALEVARRMVDHAVHELRGSVWALRSMPLHGRSFPEALQALVDIVRVSGGQKAAIHVRTEGPLTHVPEFVAGNVLLMVQEALYNALRHGRPSSIEVTARTLGEKVPIVVVVQDDGAGFAVGHQAGPERGHFGLAGMKERAERLSGSLSVRSAPGSGTTVEITVSRHALDDEVA